jgi:hypothetical protein
MKRTFFFIYFFLLIIGSVVSCTVKKPLDPVIITNTKEITKIVRDTVFQVDADSSYYEAYIKCVNGKPVLQETPETKSKSGKYLKIPTAKIDGNKLLVDCYKDEEKLHKQWEEIYIKEHEQKPIYVPQNVYVDKPLNLWQKTETWLGRIFLLIIVVGVSSFILRWKKII